MPKGRSIITELDELAEPVAPVKVMELSTHNLGVIHRSYHYYQTLQYICCMDFVLIKHYNIFDVWTLGFNLDVLTLRFNFDVWTLLFNHDVWTSFNLDVQAV